MSISHLFFGMTVGEFSALILYTDYPALCIKRNLFSAIKLLMSVCCDACVLLLR